MKIDSPAALERTERPLNVCLWSSEQFEGSKHLWDGLLHASEADPLFMSWDWQHRWWQHHAKPLDASLQLLALHGADGSLVGIAPFYSHEVRARGMRFRRLELVGVTWRSRGGVFSEYLDVIAHRAHADAVIASVAQWLEDNPLWHDLAMPCIRRESLARRLAHEYLEQFAYVREVDLIRSYSINLPAVFDDYVRQLDVHTRRRLLNQRSKLREPRMECASESEIRHYLENLRAFESARWGTTNDTLHRFNADFAACQATSGGLRLTRLTTRGRTLSVMLNVRVKSTEYYLQSGFDPALTRGVSPGYLHLGYAIESACHDGLQVFDLLAGYGRQRDYKRDLVGNHLLLTCCHIVRPPWLRTLYRTYDRFCGERGRAR
jgi:Acetyltransferase (GNAT) domain